MRYWAAGLLLTVLLFGGGWLSSGAAPDVSRSVPGLTRDRPAKMGTTRRRCGHFAAGMGRGAGGGDDHGGVSARGGPGRRPPPSTNRPWTPRPWRSGTPSITILRLRPEGLRTRTPTCAWKMPGRRSYEPRSSRPYGTPTARSWPAHFRPIRRGQPTPRDVWVSLSAGGPRKPGSPARWKSRPSWPGPLEGRKPSAKRPGRVGGVTVEAPRSGACLACGRRASRRRPRRTG